MKEKNVERILEILVREKEIFKEILSLGKEKTDVLIKRETERLNIITSIESDLAANLEILEEERVGEIEKISQILKLEEKISDVSTLARIINDKNSKTLIVCRDEIHDYIKEIKNLNDLNGKLLKNSLDYVDFFMNLVTNIDDSSDNNYSNEGKLSEGNTPKRRFDLKL